MIRPLMIRPLWMLVSIALCVVAASLALPVRAEAAYGAAEFIDSLNELRALEGAQPVVENPQWSDACEKHNLYLSLNPDAWSSSPHTEIPGTPGYTPEGAWIGPRSVLADIVPRSVVDPLSVDVFLVAPYHMVPLLDPGLRQVGFSYNKGFVCAAAPGEGLGDSASGIYVYPEDGATAVAFEFRANEAPSTPAGDLGLGDGALTGPNIIISVGGRVADTRWSVLRAEELSLTTADGAPVETRYVHTLDGYILVPLKPLQEGTKYIAHAVIIKQSTGERLEKTWSLTTDRDWERIDYEATQKELEKYASARVRARLSTTHTTVRGVGAVKLYLSTNAKFHTIIEVGISPVYGPLSTSTIGGWLYIKSKKATIPLARLLRGHKLTPGDYLIGARVQGANKETQLFLRVRR